MKRVLLLSATILTVAISSAQELYMPRNVKEAYKKETRSMDGRPGKKYWQNYGRYNITMNVMPPNRNIKGKEQITYINNSPDTLRNPIIKLILNIHKPGALRQNDVSVDYLTTGVHITSFSVNGQTTRWNDAPTGHDTWQAFRLAQPLLPHDSVQLAIEWNFDISLESNREGMIDSTTYFLAYFYPRVAVYDDYYGWDRMQFTDGQEFYNDFNDYTLTVNAPKNYIVWSTGTLQNPGEVLQKTYADKLSASMLSDDIVTIAGPAELSAKNVTVQNTVNSWKWTANNITDVTFAVSDHFVWDASSVVVDKNTQRRASVQAAYNDTAKDFHRMVSFGRHSLDWLSNNWPGVPYPFEKTTIVQGYADMEYPMMVNDGTTPDTAFSKFVVEHEIAHTWFPFYMGINETRYGFMDEGWATTFELLIGRADVGNDKAESLYKQFRVNSWINDLQAEQDLPIITPSNILSGVALGNNEYGKASLGYLAVKDMLGDELFRKCLHAFMDHWHGKHPTPWDFFYTFNDVSGKDLNWFWTSWYFSNGYIDFGIQKADKSRKGYTVAIQNIGGFPAPVDVVATYTDGTTETKHLNPGVWSNTAITELLFATKKTMQSVELKGGVFVDATRADNKLQLK
ncbi:MAG: M1 family metallopeptidase [Bacteroidota bacterium]